MPKHAIGAPRSDAIARAAWGSMLAGASCQMVVGSHAFHAVSVRPSQNSRRPS